MAAKNISLRMTEDKIDRIDKLAKAMGRSRAWILNQATDHFLDYEEWFVQEVKDGLKEVEEGKIASQAEVLDRFKKWGANVR